MNKDQLTLLNVYDSSLTQRELASLSKFSLGKVNKVMNSLKESGVISKSGLKEVKVKDYKVNSAILLAAGFGLRMMPLDKESPKALLKVNGEILIERLISQLKAKGIHNIYIVVGFQKEKFEYLIDKYDVTLLVNNNYTYDNNLLSVLKASKYINHSYIIPSDLYIKDNIFRLYEDNSYYCLSKERVARGYYFISKDKKLMIGKNKFYDALGVAFISKADKVDLIDNMKLLSLNNNPNYWEDALFMKNKEIPLNVRSIPKAMYYEINTYNDLIKLDHASDSLNSANLEIIKKVFNVELKDIKNVTVSKKGMTNKSFTFEISNKRYIMRIPGEGTDKLINREEEYEIYQTLKPYDIADKTLYMDPSSGVKITEFIYDSHNCDISNWDEVNKCMKKLKEFHNLKLKVGFSFDLLKQINYYESLRGEVSLYSDYLIVKDRCLKLFNYIDKYKLEPQLCHIDSVPDNFMITKKEIRLIDWEYAANQDPHLDIAMFIIYSGYSKEEADKLIDLYFDNKCEEAIRYKIYAYIALAGLLWSNWCEYKHHLGIEFGEYSLNQYRYAKVYSKLVLNHLGEAYE